MHQSLYENSVFLIFLFVSLYGLLSHFPEMSDQFQPKNTHLVNVLLTWQNLLTASLSFKTLCFFFFFFLVKSLTFIDFPDRAEIDHLSFCATAFSLSTKMKAHICQRKGAKFLFFCNAMTFIGKFQILDFWCCWLIYF